MSEIKYYTKQGRRYVEHKGYLETGLPPGLWLITNKPSSRSVENVLYATKTHNIQDVSLYSDLLVKYRDRLLSCLEVPFERERGFSRQDLVETLLAEIANIMDEERQEIKSELH